MALLPFRAAVRVVNLLGAPSDLRPTLIRDQPLLPLPSPDSKRIAVSRPLANGQFVLEAPVAGQFFAEARTAGAGFGPELADV